jgi:hypothetical protein
MGRQSGMSQGLTMPADWIRDKFCGDSVVPEKVLKKFMGLPIVIPCSAVERPQEHGKRLKGFPAAWMPFNPQTKGLVSW